MSACLHRAGCFQCNAGMNGTACACDALQQQQQVVVVAVAVVTAPHSPHTWRRQREQRHRQRKQQKTSGREIKARPTWCISRYNIKHVVCPGALILCTRCGVERGFKGVATVCCVCTAVCALHVGVVCWLAVQSSPPGALFCFVTHKHRQNIKRARPLDQLGAAGLGFLKPPLSW